MALWKLHGDGKTIAPGAVVNPDERLNWGITVGMGMQHVVAMFGATFLVPLLTGFPPATTLLFSGLGTIIFLLVTGNRLPSYLGSSFAFISPIAAAMGMADGGMGTALFGVLLSGITLAIVGAIVHFSGAGWIDRLMPPAMTGTIVMLIGFNLAGAAKNNFQHLYSAENGDTVALGQHADLTGWITVIAIVLITVLFRGLIGRLSILLGVLVGYVAAVLQGQVDFSKIQGAIDEYGWFGPPEFTLPTPSISVIGLFLPVVFVLIAENVGHVKSVSLMTGKNFDKDMGRALLGDGLATTFAALGGGSGTTTYAENIGVMAATKVYSTALYWVAAITALILSFIPPFGAAISTVPAGVLGGAGVVLYGMIGLLGARIWVENKVNFASAVNLFPAAVGLIIGISDLSFTVADIAFGGVAVGTVAALLLYHLMRVIAAWRRTDIAA